MDKNLLLQIVLVRPPAGVFYALQKGGGTKYDLEQQQTSTGGDVSFDLTVVAKTGKDGQPDFKGGYIQGPAGERFIYIGIGTYAGDAASPWGRRLKIPLKGISWHLVNSGAIETHVAGKGNDGTPACATPKPFAGWVKSMSSKKPH